MIAMITITCDNVAFEDNPTELGRILHDAAVTYGRVNDWPKGMENKLFDTNGNTVGTITIVPDPD